MNLCCAGREDLCPANSQRKDRKARANGEKAAVIPVVDEDPTKPSALPTPDSYQFFSAWEAKSPWKNEVTVKRYNSRFFSCSAIQCQD